MEVLPRCGLSLRFSAEAIDVSEFSVVFNTKRVAKKGG